MDQDGCYEAVREDPEFCTKYPAEAIYNCPASCGICNSVQCECNLLITVLQEPTDKANQNSLFRSRDWLSANRGPVFPDSVGSW